MKRLFLVDGYALIYRAFFAMLSRPLTTSKGENTSVAWGIANFLLRLADKHHPDYVAWINDAGSSFRHEKLPEYKATREKLNAELQQDFDRSVQRVEQLLVAYRVPLVTVDGYEADDVIATLATRAAQKDLETVIVSGDKDFYQLITPAITLLNPGRGGPAAVEEQFVTSANANERFGVPPDRIVDYLALVGDSSDNVPGVSGIGEKTAQKLITDFGDLETILARAAEVTAKRPRESLLAQADRARLSRELVTLHRDVPVTLDLEDLVARPPDWASLLPILRELEFHTLVRSISDRVAAEERMSVPPADDDFTEAAPVPLPAAGASQPVVVVSSPEAASEMVATIRRIGTLAIGVLGTSGNAMRSAIIGIALAADGRSWYLPFGHRTEGEFFDTAGAANLPPLADPSLAPLVQLLGDATVEKVGHDIKYALLVLRRAGVPLRGIVFDTMLASFMVDPGKRSHALDIVASEHAGIELRPLGEALARGRDEKPLAELPVQDVAAHLGARVGVMLRLRARLEPLLEEHALAPLFARVELPLIGVLADMEWEGVGIDRAVFERLTTEFKAELATLERAIHEAAGIDFNILSTPQLRHVLFEKLMLPVIKKTKTGPSTDADVLEELAAQGHTVPTLLLQYREISKLLSTYTEALPASIDAGTSRIHTTFGQIGAATGRISSTDPNLQNIPVRTARGAEIRRGFIPRPGWRYVVADYSQIELRLLAHLSDDTAFVDAFRKGGDIHRQTAAVIFGVPLESVTSEQRSQAKTINFATIYGQGARALSMQLGITQAEAKQFIDEYFTRFSGVRTFLDVCVAKAKEKGYAETILGRRRYIPELKDKNFNTRAFGERTATNSPIQGSAADLIKVAMVRLRDALAAGYKARLVLQVHDELIVEAPAEEAEAVAALVKRHMESAAELKVPLVADVGIGVNWVDAKH